MDLPSTTDHTTTDTTLNFDEICRLCLTKLPNMSPIFTIPIPTRIMSLVCIEMCEGDGLPALICQQCCIEVDRSYKFQMLCRSSDTTLRQYILRNISTSSHVSSESNSSFTSCHSAEELSCEPEILVEESNRTECCTILPHLRQETTMESGNIVIACNVELPNGRNIPVPVECPRNVNKPLNKEYVDSTSTVKRKFIPSLPRIIKIMRPKQAYQNIRKQGSFAARSRQTSFCCDICSKSFTQRDNLKEHQVIHKGEKPYLCDECGKSFARKQELDAHIRYHSGVRPYSCTLCDKTFLSASAQKDHENQHNGIKPFLCNICGKTFLRKSGLANHERVHLEEKQYSCNHCGKTFTTFTNLKAHEKRHTGISEFCCRICEKTFFTKSGLERHELVHAGNKQFPCKICSSSFFTKTEITRHMRYHTKEKRFNCNQCYRSFIENQHLIVHQRIHSGEKPYLCNLCKKAFYTKSKLNRHMRTHDGNRS